jgi:hypothetical protein
MWMIPPSMLCSKHLVGEHGELHKFIPSFRKKYKIDKRIAPIVQIQLSSYKPRHDELADEMKKRHMNHNSPLLNKDIPDFSYLPKEQLEAKVDLNLSIKELIKRCPKCKEVIKNVNASTDPNTVLQPLYVRQAQ